MTRIFPKATTLFLALFLALALGAPASADSGTFTGRSGHKMSGGVSIVERDGAHVIVMHSDFYLDGAPAPRVALGRGGRFAKGTDFAKLRANRGVQEYVIPTGLDVSQFTDVVVWCKKFSVPLGVAPLD